MCHEVVISTQSYILALIISVYIYLLRENCIGDDGGGRGDGSCHDDARQSRRRSKSWRRRRRKERSEDLSSAFDRVCKAAGSGPRSSQRAAASPLPRGPDASMQRGTQTVQQHPRLQTQTHASPERDKCAGYDAKRD